MNIVLHKSRAGAVALCSFPSSSNQTVAVSLLGRAAATSQLSHNGERSQERNRVQVRSYETQQAGNADETRRTPQGVQVPLLRALPWLLSLLREREQVEIGLDQRGDAGGEFGRWGGGELQIRGCSRGRACIRR